MTSCSGSSTSPEPPLVFDVGANDKTAVVAFGDDLTAGTGSTDGKGYRRALRQQLANGGRPGLRVVDEGVVGSLVQDGAARVGGVLQRDRPAALLVLYGHSDALDAIEPGTPIGALGDTVDKLRAIVRAARANRTLVVLATVPPVCGIHREGQRATIAALNTGIRALAGELSATDFGVVLADPWADFVTDAPPDGCALLDYAGAIPTDSGYTVLAATFYRALGQLAW